MTLVVKAGPLPRAFVAKTSTVNIVEVKQLELDTSNAYSHILRQEVAGMVTEPHSVQFAVSVNVIVYV